MKHLACPFLNLHTWMAALFLLVSHSSQLIAEEFHHHPDRETESVEDLIPLQSFKRMRNAFNSEAYDVANALRSLDQSFTYRGIRGCGSCTAGSVFVDWESKGLKRPEGVRILPPEPLNLSGRTLVNDCQTCGEKIASLKDCRDCRTQQVAPPCQSCEQDCEFTVAFKICMKSCETSQYTPIISMGEDWADANFSVGQIGNEIRFRYLTDMQDEFHSFQHEVNLGKLSPGKHQLSMRYTPGKLVIHIDHSHFGTLNNIHGCLNSWKDESIRIQDDWTDRVKDLEVVTPNYENLEVLNEQAHAISD